MNGMKNTLVEHGRKTMSKKMSQEKAYDEWQEWLDKCPVSYTHGRHPTSFIEVINFDFNDYDSEEE